MKAKYIKPAINIIASPCSMLASSTKKHPCDKYCRLWHICRDRELGKICEDYIITCENNGKVQDCTPIPLLHWLHTHRYMGCAEIKKRVFL